jgi:hypothetical protein
MFPSDFLLKSLQQLEDRKSSQCISNPSKPGNNHDPVTTIERAFSIPLLLNELDSDKTDGALNNRKNYQINKSDDDDSENQLNTSRKRSSAIQLKDRQEPFSKSKPKNQRQALRTITLINEERRDDEKLLSELKPSVIHLDFKISNHMIISIWILKIIT